MTKDRIWLISVAVCFAAAVFGLAGPAIGMPDTLVRIIGVINLVSLAIVMYRTVKGRMRE